MAIKINNTTVVDDSKNFFIEDIQFSDLTVASVASDSGGSNSESLYKPFDLVHTLDNLDSFRGGGNLAYPAGGQFGYSAAISENYVIVTTNAAYLDATTYSSGFAYVYDVNSGKLLHILVNPNAYSTATSDQFGRNVSISGDYAIFGVELEDEAGSNSSGKAYIFNLANGHLVSVLNNPNAYSTATSDIFGCSVAISGNYAVVGAYQEDQAGYSNSGKAYIYRTITGDWTDTRLHYTVSNPNGYSTPASDLFGYTVSISGKNADEVFSNYAMITGYGEDDASGTSSGKVYMINLTTGGLNRTYNNPNVYSTSTSDYFGWAISYHGYYVAISAYYEDSITGSQSGVVYIFSTTSGALIKTLTNPVLENDTSHTFGYSLEMVGNYLVIGAPGYWDADAGQTSGSASGRAYVYKTTTGDWTDATLTKTIENPNAYSTPDGDNFGRVVGIGGNNIIATAYLEDDPLNNIQSTYSGRAYVFAVENIVKVKNIINDKVAGLATTIHASTSLPVIEVLPISWINGDNKFGYPIVANDKYVAVSALYFDDFPGGSDLGYVFIYDKTGNILHGIRNPSESVNDQFGYSLALSGDYLFIGTPFDNPGGITDSGQVFIYNINTQSIVKTLTNPNHYSTGQEDYFGAGIAVTGNYLIAGAPAEDQSASDHNTGVLYIYQTTTGDWTDATLVRTIENPNAYSTSDNDQFGGYVSASGNYAIVGTWAEEDASGDYSGKAYIFNVITGALVYTLDNPNVYSTSANDQFGQSVAIYGNYAVVGALGEDGDSGDQSGKAYVYKTITGDWTDTSLIYILKNPNTYNLEVNDWFGLTVAITDDYIAVGTPRENNPSGSNAGAVYVYSKFNGRLIHTIKNPNFDYPQTGDEFGKGISIYDSRIYISSWGTDHYLEGSDLGKFYIYDIGEYSLENKLIKYLNTL